MPTGDFHHHTLYIMYGTRFKSPKNWCPLVTQLGQHSWGYCAEPAHLEPPSREAKLRTAGLVSVLVHVCSQRKFNIRRMRTHFRKKPRPRTEKFVAVNKVTTKANVFWQTPYDLSLKWTFRSWPIEMLYTWARHALWKNKKAQNRMTWPRQWFAICTCHFLKTKMIFISFWRNFLPSSCRIFTLCWPHRVYVAFFVTPVVQNKHAANDVQRLSVRQIGDVGNDSNCQSMLLTYPVPNMLGHWRTPNW